MRPYLAHLNIMLRTVHSRRPKASSKAGTAAGLIPRNASLDELRNIARGCKACHLWETGTQTVFGEGPAKSEIMFVGEQPGDYEDRSGHPFVGPAGRLLDQALKEIGLDRSEVYVTNVVKHFKWIARGKRRIHEKPRGPEISACRPWLEAEIEQIRPRIIVCLGATAAQALLGRTFSVTRQRGKPVKSDLAPVVVATVHPSSLFRIEDDKERHSAIRQFTDDIKEALKAAKAARLAA